MRLIDADKLKRKAQKVGTEAWKMKLTAPIETTLNQFIDWIDEAPTIEVVPKDFHDKTCEAMAKRHTEEIQRLMPKRGEWIVKQSGFAECSVCEQHSFRDYNFCPNCGARMKGADDE